MNIKIQVENWDEELPLQAEFKKLIHQNTNQDRWNVEDGVSLSVQSRVKVRKDMH